MAKKSSGKGAAALKQHWKEQPDAHDYPAALAYLSLLLDPSKANKLVEELKNAPIVHGKAKDLLRASRLPALTPKNPEVATDLAKVRRGEALSPVLLVRGDFSHDIPLVIADGYHRICASYLIELDAEIPCRLAGNPGPKERTS